MLFNHLLLCRPLVLLPSIFPSIRVFSNELTLCIKWPKHWTSVSVLVLLMFKVDFVLISLQSEGLSRVFSAPQFKSINSSVLSLLYGPTLTSVHDYWKEQSTVHDYWKEQSISLTTWTFVSKVMSLLFNMLSKFVIAFLPRSKHFNFMAAVTICSDFGAQKRKIHHCFHFFRSICHEVMGS